VLILMKDLLFIHYLLAYLRDILILLSTIVSSVKEAINMVYRETYFFISYWFGIIRFSSHVELALIDTARGQPLVFVVARFPLFGNEHRIDDVGRIHRNPVGIVEFRSVGDRSRNRCESTTKA